MLTRPSAIVTVIVVYVCACVLQHMLNNVNKALCNSYHNSCVCLCIFVLQHMLNKISVKKTRCHSLQWVNFSSCFLIRQVTFVQLLSLLTTHLGMLPRSNDQRLGLGDVYTKSRQRGRRGRESYKENRILQSQFKLGPSYLPSQLYPVGLVSPYTYFISFFYKMILK